MVSSLFQASEVCKLDFTRKIGWYSIILDFFSLLILTQYMNSYLLIVQGNFAISQLRFIEDGKRFFFRF
jgi:hypothetical protein